MSTLRELWNVLLAFLRAFLYGWLLQLIRQMRRAAWRRSHKRDGHVGERGHSRLKCAPIPESLYRRPDPLIYSQHYLMTLGMGVTWDNPDIQLLRGGVPVSSSILKADTEYEVVATIWNGSTEAPAPGLPVRFSFLDFGIGTTQVAIGQTVVDLPIKGAPGHPVAATQVWRTPTTPGHYCLQVELIWPDDAEPKNNLGQENTNVATASSPVTFRFPLRNSEDRRRRFRFEADSYSPPPIPLCPPGAGVGADREPGVWMDEEEEEEEEERLLRERQERGEREQAVIARHDQRQFPVPPGWSVNLSDWELELDPGEIREIRADVEPPDGFSGRLPINVNAFTDGTPVGGVTLFVER